MGTNDTETIGARMRYWRLRRGGMTQSALAGLAGVSQPFISQVEGGKKTIDNRSTLVAIAAALKITMADLLGQPGDPADPAKDGAADAIPAIRVALVEIEEGERHTPTWTVERLEDGIARLAELRCRADYAAMSRLLPATLTEAAAYGGRHLAQVAYESATTLKNLGYRDLALPAARVAVAAAEEAEDLPWIGAARYFHAVVLPMESPRLAARVAERSIGALQPRAADPNVRQMLGQLHLTASLTCAVDRRPDDAHAHLAAADAEAATLGGDPADGTGFNLLGFGPTNIALWRLNVLAETREYEHVIELARKFPPGPLRMADRHYSYWLTVGRALAQTGRDRQAMAAFMRADRAAPTAFGLSPLAHNAVLSLVHRARRRALPSDLRVLARRVGIDPAP